MNIDLRNIDADLENIIEEMKQSGKAATATKCVELALRNYLPSLEKITKLSEDLRKAEQKNYYMKNDISNFVDAFKDLKEHVKKK